MLCLFPAIAKLLQFSQLATLLGVTEDTVSLLRTVQQVAVLVQGNWVVRSDILYPKDTASSIGGVPAELMCRGRDYIVS
jgi:DNA-directed RNA polymerase-3 subunit RPC5